MAEKPKGLPGVLRRAVAVGAAMAVLTALAQVASAEPSTKDKLEAAKAEFERLKDKITAQQQVVSTLLLEAQRIAERKELAFGDVDPGAVVTTASVQPESRASRRRCCSNAVCTPRRRNAGNVAAPASCAMSPSTRMLAAPATCPSIRAT